MNKILLSVGILVASLTASAQTVVYQASDTTQFFYDGFQTYDADGDGYNWNVGTAGDSHGDFFYSASYDTSASTPALTPDNWLISPAINLAGYYSSTLSWDRLALSSSYPSEKYSVYVVTDLATALTATPVFTETIVTGGVWATETVDISAYDNQTIYVLFRHYDCTDQYVLGIDDITVSGTGVASVAEVANNIKVYPNPANDVLNISLNEDISSVSVLTLDGKVVANQSVNGTTTSVNVSDLKAGVYFYEVNTSNGIVVRNTFVKQ